jgi:hypothetical protein
MRQTLVATKRWWQFEWFEWTNSAASWCWLKNIQPSKMESQPVSLQKLWVNHQKRISNPQIMRSSSQFMVMLPDDTGAIGIVCLIMVMIYIYIIYLHQTQMGGRWGRGCPPQPPTHGFKMAITCTCMKLFRIQRFHQQKWIDCIDASVRKCKRPRNCHVGWGKWCLIPQIPLCSDKPKRGGYRSPVPQSMTSGPIPNGSRV